MVRRTSLLCLIATTPVVVFAASVSFAADVPTEAPAPRIRPTIVSPTILRATAEAAEVEKQWETALDLYLRLYTEHKPTPELRERIKFCLRHATQVKRHRDPAFQQFVTSLPAADALNLYAEVVSKLSTLHVERDRATAANLFTLGLDEFDRALSDVSFRQKNFAGVSEAKMQEFRQTIRELAKLRPPANPREARLAVREIVSEAQRQIGVRNASVVVCEFLCGACAGMDEFTRYVPAAAPERDATDPTIDSAKMLVKEDGLGYFRIVTFRDSTPREVEDAMLSLRSQGMRALIVDLRGNAGGSFPAAVLVAQRFLAGGVIVSTDGPATEFAGRIFSSDSGMSAYNLPVVVLVDAKTMSAAEVLAAAWKSHDRAVLVGTATFGKGVVQAPIRLQSLDPIEAANPRSGVLVLTVANLYDPRGLPLNGVGVTPHFAVADPNRQLDVAIGKALELLGAMPMPMP